MQNEERNEFYEKKSRDDAVKSVVAELKHLHEDEEVYELMQGGYIAELNAIARRIDFSKLDKLFDEEKIDLLLELEEIPEKYRYEMIFYFNRYNKEDMKIFKDFQEIIEYFQGKEEIVAQNIGETMWADNLCKLRLEDLIFGIGYDEEEEE